MTDQAKKVAFLLANEFDDSQMQSPYEAITKNGHEAVIISLESGDELVGQYGSITYTSPQSAGEANAGKIQCSRYSRRRITRAFAGE